MGKLRQLPKKQASTSGEVIGYLYEKASYWLYERQNRYRARAYAARLERLIRGHGDSGKNVLHSDCLALIAETRADWPNVARHRKRELQLILRLRATAKKGDAIDRGVLLEPSYVAMLYEDLTIAYMNAGQLRQADRTLKELEAFVRRQRLNFETDSLKNELACKRAKQAGTR